mmetsp:Transcript_6425/g.15908  ORF Transcript_6425/g.15908 Transcript_6425/m.15908 type:complete len:432 (+) Transcript_6425:309-1604(+)
MRDADATETPRRMALHKPPPSLLRAPQPEPASPFLPTPSLGAPQPKDDQSVATGINIDEIEVPYARNAKKNSDSGNDRDPTSGNGRRRVHRRSLHRRQASATSRNSMSSRASSRSGSNTMEPENDAGAQPLHKNVVRKASLNVSMAEAEGTPYASVTRVRDSDTTAPTLEVSYETSTGSNNNLTRSSNFSNANIANLEAARLNAKLKRYPPRAATMTFSGDIATTTTSTSRVRSRASPDPDEPSGPPRGISAACAPNEDRISSTSFSMADFAGSRGSSVLAEVVDEAQLEAEFNERMKSRIVEAIEIRPSRSAGGDVESRTGGRPSVGSKESEKRRKTAAELARLKKQRRMIRCVIACITAILMSGLLIAILLILLKNKQTGVQSGGNDPNSAMGYDTRFFDLDDDAWRSENVTEDEGITYADVFLIGNDD